MPRQRCEVGRPSRGRIHGRCNKCPKAEGTGSFSWESMKHRSRFKVVSSGHHICSVVVARLGNGDSKGTVELEECAELLPGAPRRGGFGKSYAIYQTQCRRQMGAMIG